MRRDMSQDHMIVVL